MAYHSAIRYGQSIITFGGETGPNKYSNSVHQYYLKTNKSVFPYRNTKRIEIRYNVENQVVVFEKLDMKGELPSARSHHAACLVDFRFMYIIGGKNQSIKLSDIFCIDLFKNESSKVNYTGSKLPAMYGK